MIKISLNNLHNLARHEGALSTLSFLNQSELNFLMKRLISNVTSSTHLELLNDFDGDITETASMIEKLQDVLNASNDIFLSDGINIRDFFDIDDDGVINVLGFQIRKGGTVDKQKIKEHLIENNVGVDFEEYKRIIKVARSKKTDNISLPINPTEDEKFLYLSLKALEGKVYELTSKIQKELSNYRKLRMDYDPKELDIVDSKIHGFSRTMVDGVIQSSTYFTSSEILQISSKHKKDIGAMEFIRKMQETMKKTGVIAVEIDSDDSLEKMSNYIKDTEYFTLNIGRGFILKGRKLGNYASRKSTLLGMYMHDGGIIAVDSRDPSALAHEYAHAVDFNNDFISDEVRSSFIGVMKHLLDRQYNHNYSSGEVVDAYLYLNESENLSKIKNDLMALSNYLDLDTVLNDKELLAKLIVSPIDRKEFANNLEIDLIHQGFSKSESFKARGLFLDVLSNISIPDNGGDRIVEYILSRGKDTIHAKELSDEMVEYVISRGNAKKESYSNLPPDYSYLSMPTEIIARAGEIGFVLAKYGYKGHKNQEELEDFINKVREIQEAELRTSKKIRGCHHIDTYIGRSEYFGFRDLKESSLMLIKDYYGQFFKPNFILSDVVNSEIVSDVNNARMDVISNSDFRDRLNNMVEQEFKYEIERKELKKGRKTTKRGRFDKDAYPISHLRGYDDLDMLISVNQEEGVFSSREVCSYIINNIGNMGRTQMDEKINTDKIRMRLTALALLLKNKEKYSEKMQKALTIIERGLLESPRGSELFKIRQSLQSDGSYGLNLLHDASKDFIELSFRGRQLGIKEFVYELSKAPIDDIYELTSKINKTSGLAEMVELRSSCRKKNSVMLDVMNADSKTYLDDFKSYIDADIDKLEQSESLEERAYYFLKALKRFTPLSEVVDISKDFVDYINKVNVSDVLTEGELYILSEYVSFGDREVNEDDFKSRLSDYEHKFRYLRPRTQVEIDNQVLDLNIFNDQGKVLFFDFLMKVSEHTKVFRAESHAPKKKIKSDADKIEFMSSLKFNQIDPVILRNHFSRFYKKENLSTEEVERVKASLAHLIGYDVSKKISKMVNNGEKPRSVMNYVGEVLSFLKGRQDSDKLRSDLPYLEREYLKYKTMVYYPKVKDLNKTEHYERLIKEHIKPLFAVFNDILNNDKKLKSFILDKFDLSNSAKNNEFMSMLITYALVEKVGKSDSQNVFEKLLTRRLGDVPEPQVKNKSNGKGQLQLF